MMSLRFDIVTLGTATAEHLYYIYIGMDFAEALTIEGPL
jgi:hypothetical protein